MGYLADEAEHELICDYAGDLVATVERGTVFHRDRRWKKQPFQIIKAADNGKTDAESAYLVPDLRHILLLFFGNERRW